MVDFIKTFAVKVGHLPTAEQLAALDAKALTLNFKTTRERVEDELRYFLTRAGKREEHSEAFKASPWCGHFAMMEHILERAGKSIPYQLYPDDPDARLALESVISEFGSFEIHRKVSPVMSHLFAVQHGLGQFEKASNLLPAGSPLLAAFQKLEPGLRDYSASLQTEIDRRANHPAEYKQPLRDRRLQRRVYYVVRRLCKPKDGPDKLANFVTNVLKEWPYVPARMTLDLEERFSADNRRKLVRDHLGLAEGEMNKEGGALWRVLNAIVLRDELRGSLLHLAHKAHQQSEQRRKGWPHLRKALRAVFYHIRRELSDEEMFRNFERANFAWMRNLTRDQRMRLLPELGNDPDHTALDLTKKERMILFKRFNKRNRTLLKRDADGRASFATRYGRAMKAVRKELGQD